MKKQSLYLYSDYVSILVNKLCIRYNYLLYLCVICGLEALTQSVCSTHSNQRGRDNRKWRIIRCRRIVQSEPPQEVLKPILTAG